MKNEIQTFLNALQFYTRIPLGKLAKYTPKRQEDSIRYFPIIGILVGTAMAFTIILLKGQLGCFTAIILGLLVGVLFTGGLHEDGLADCCDGFGGGWTKEKVLEIMKDSSIGAYGAIGLIFLFFLKLSLLSKLIPLYSNTMIFILILMIHVVSRSGAASMMRFLDYARSDNSSKSFHIAKRLSLVNTVIVIACMLLPIIGVAIYTNNIWWLILFPILFLLVVFMSVYFKKKIEGYTGDCLGMLQQLSELTLYATCIFLWN
ncbi:MAG: adenosylcobinamide-GDP ribazoletransferase [Crocinitomicaceae bacterium]|nr:adenosylcobinamide-GDP ribazoletransferase [Crocinitomicaceae bacterium]